MVGAALGLYIDGAFYAAARIGGARLPGRGAGRSAAGTPRHALRQEHHRRCHQRDDAEATLHPVERIRAQRRQPWIRAGKGLGHWSPRRPPSPLEETGGPGFKDISGSVLPAISEWAASVGGEYANPGTILGRAGEYFGALDASYRSSFSSSPSASKYLVVEGYSLLNARFGFRATEGWTLSLWARNLLDKDYFDLLSPVSGGTGLYVGQPGDGRTAGLTMRITLGS